MSKLTLVDERGMLVPNAGVHLALRIAFPYDEDARKQAFDLAESERARFRKAGGAEKWRPTTLTRNVLNGLNNEAGQRAVAGYTTIAFGLLKAQDPKKQPTLYAAAQVVERALKRASRDDPKPIKMIHLKDGTWQVDGQRCPSTRNGIEKAWLEFHSVSHLIAADAICNEWFPAQVIFDRTPESLMVLLRIASLMENNILHPAEKRGFEIVQVSHQGSRLPYLPVSQLPGQATAEFLKMGL